MKALDVANWFIRRAKSDVDLNGGEYMSHLKLQKLLYYAQGCSLAMNKKPLFDEDIFNWAHGPVVPQVYSEFKSYADNNIEKYRDINVTSETDALLEEVYNVFGQFSAWKLRNMTHAEDPWKNTTTNQIIDKSSIQTYFEKEYVTN